MTNTLHLTSKRTIWSAAFYSTLLCFAGSCGAEAAREVTEAEKKEATEMIATTKGQLVKSLMGSVQEHGPAKALDACRLDAPEIMKTVAATGYEVGRTTQRLRNPKNAAETTLATWLTSYENAPIDKTSRSQITPDGKVLYAEPLFIKPLCLTCHGDSIPADVQGELDRLYPEDQATNYKEGDFRGLIWIKF